MAQVFSCEFWEVSKNTFLNRTSSVAASVNKTKDIKKNVKQKIDEKSWELRYTNADLKFALYVQVHIKVISWKFIILNRKNSGVIPP